MPIIVESQKALLSKRVLFFDIYPKVVMLGLFLALLLIFFLPAETKRIYFSLGWLTVLVWFFEFKKPAKAVRPLLWMICLFFIYRAGHSMWVYHSWVPSGRQPEHTLLILGIFIGYLSSKPWQMPSLPTVFFFVLRLFLIVATYLVLFSIFSLNLERGDFWNHYNVIAFTGIILSGFLAFLGCWLQRGQFNFLSILDLLFMVGLIFICVYFSETRNVLLTLLVVSGILFTLAHIPHKKKLMVSGLLFCIIMLGIYGNHFMKQMRLNQVVSEVSTYQENSSTSIGMRLEMWRTSLLITKEAPIVGVGYEERAKKIDKLIETGVINPAVGKFQAVHSDYLEELSIRGIIGLVLLLSLYFIMVKLSFVGREKDGVVLPLLAIPLTLIVLGLPDNFLTHRNAFFVFCILYILSFAINRQRFLDSESSV